MDREKKDKEKWASMCYIAFVWQYTAGTPDPAKRDDGQWKRRSIRYSAVTTNK